MIITPDSIPSYVRREGGSKMYNLYLLGKEGFSVPAWVGFPQAFFSEFLRENNLYDQIAEKLNTLHRSPQLGALRRNTTQEIQDLIMNASLSRAMKSAVRKALHLLQSKSVAVRSSAIYEDIPLFSFAGVYDSYLRLRTEEQIFWSIKNCWSSVFNIRSLEYRIVHGLPFSVAECMIGVITQTMIEPEKSGIAFTIDPRYSTNNMLISATFGSSEKLVDGRTTGSDIAVDRDSFSVKKVSKDSSTEILSHEELKKIITLSLQIEKYYHYPQDIEWAIQNKKLFVLQSRPITTITKTTIGTMRIWDNANIIESYEGLTLPLTFTFARHLYSQVYKQFCEILMIPPKKIQQMEWFLNNMLGLFQGRVYYNLLNWYRLTSILPGYQHNRGFMEIMMGTKKSLKNEMAKQVQSLTSRNFISLTFMKCLIGIKFFYYHLTIQGQIDKFMQYFSGIYERKKKIDFTRLSADEILPIYYHLKSTLLREWKAPIINDFLCMIYFGLLRKLSLQFFKGKGEQLQNDLLASEKHLDSTQPTYALLQLAKEAQKKPGLKKILLVTPSVVALEKIRQSRYKKFYKYVREYIDRYGFRCMNEMKLEQKDLTQDQTFLFDCLKNYLSLSQMPDSAKIKKKESLRRHDAEVFVTKHLSFPQKQLYFWVLGNARKALRNRENTRFCRTKIYGIARKMFFQIGTQFAQRGILQIPEDIFYLELYEVLGALEGTLTIQNLKQLVVLRKQEYTRYQNENPPDRFVTYGPVYWLNSYANISPSSSDQDNSQMKGVPCSPGIVEKSVRVIRTASDIVNLKKEILVTKRTDPGWIPLYPSISGLLIERGSLLSHSAVVAREMGIPTVVGITGITNKVKDGMVVRMNGSTGEVSIIKKISSKLCFGV